MDIVCSTSNLKGNRRSIWQETISELFAPLDIDIGDPASFTGEIGRTNVGSVELTHSIVDNEFARRTRRHVANRGADECVIVHVSQGPLTICQFGRESAIASGCYTLLDLSEPFMLQHRGRTSTYFLKTSKRGLKYRIRDLEAHCAVSHAGGSGVAAVGSDLIASMARNADAATGAAALALAEHAIDFFSLVFGTADHGLAESSSIACEALRRRAKQYIDQHLDDLELSPERVAGALRVSLRYLHRAFEGSGTSVNGYVRTQRLTQCRDALLKASGGAIRISELSERYGFRNASYFSTCFKAEFGVSPRAIRSESAD